MNIPTLAGQTPASTYQRLAQVSGSILADGLGNTINSLNVTASFSAQILDNGIVTLLSGSVLVESEHASENNIILLAYYSLDSSIASIHYSDVVEETSFNIKSSNSEDTNKVSWVILKL